MDFIMEKIKLENIREFKDLYDEYDSLSNLYFNKDKEIKDNLSLEIESIKQIVAFSEVEDVPLGYLVKVKSKLLGFIPRKKTYLANMNDSTSNSIISEFVFNNAGESKIELERFGDRYNKI